MQKRPKGKHGVEIVLHQTELIQLQVLDCSLLVLKLERKSFLSIKYINIRCGHVVRDFESKAKNRCNFQF